jgi:hypothetical protein
MPMARSWHMPQSGTGSRLSVSPVGALTLSQICGSPSLMNGSSVLFRGDQTNWMGIEIRPYNITFDRLKNLLSEQRIETRTKAKGED